MPKDRNALPTYQIGILVTNKTPPTKIVKSLDLKNACPKKCEARRDEPANKEIDQHKLHTAS